MNGKVGAPKATKEVFAAVEEVVDRLISEGGGWDAGLRMLADAGDPTTGPSLARNDWYRLRRALEIIKVLECNVLTSVLLHVSLTHAYFRDLRTF